MKNVLEVLKISKRFNEVKALDNVDFDLKPGEVHALVGENGAGKSTLVKIISGLLRPDSGNIYLDEKKISFNNPQQAQDAGISTISQEFNLVDQLTVSENIFLGHEIKRKNGLINWKKTIKETKALLQEFNIQISPQQLMQFLTVSEKQHVEIVKALSRKFNFIIMDEPTAVLADEEVKHLFDVINTMRKRNLSVLYVSHRLKEIFNIADRVTVLRDGKKVGTRRIEETNENEVISMMLGKAIKDYSIVRKEIKSHQHIALSIKNLSAGKTLKEVSLDLHSGEVLSLAGLLGSGRYDLMKAIAGLIPYSSEKIIVNGLETVIKKPIDAIKAGISLLPEDRKIEGIFPELSILENMFINARHPEKRFKGIIIDTKFEKKMFNELQSFLKIKAFSTKQLITALSGGNQQKTMVGRTLTSKSSILLLNEPSRGVDVGTKAEIRFIIRRLADEGKAVLVSSSDIPELVSFSDRCIVLNGGRINKILVGDEITEDNITRYAVTQLKETKND